MRFKLIIIMVEDKRTSSILEAAREAGATGCTVLNQARGEGINPGKTFLGLKLFSVMRKTRSAGRSNSNLVYLA